MASVTSLLVPDAITALPHVTFGPKRGYGKKEYGMKISTVKMKGSAFVVDMGVDPTEPDADPNSIEYVTTNWGVSHFKKDNEPAFPNMYGGNNNNNGGYPGGPGGYPGWPPGSMPPGSMPPGASYPMGSNDSSAADSEPDESSLPARRNVDLVFQEGSLNKKCLDDFDNRVRQEAQQRSMEWFNHEHNDDLFAHMFSKSVKPSGDDMLLTLRAKVHMPSLKVWRMDLETKRIAPASYKQIKRDVRMKVLLCAEDVWFQASNDKSKPVKAIGVHWKVQSVLLYDGVLNSDFNFHVAAPFELAKTEEGDDWEEDKGDHANAAVNLKRPCPFPGGGPPVPPQPSAGQ